MSDLFQSILRVITIDSNINIPLLVKVRKAKMELLGMPTNHIKWDHYTKVLQAKVELAKINLQRS